MAGIEPDDEPGPLRRARGVGHEAVFGHAYAGGVEDLCAICADPESPEPVPRFRDPGDPGDPDEGYPACRVPDDRWGMVQRDERGFYHRRTGNRLRQLPAPWGVRYVPDDPDDEFGVWDDGNGREG